MLINYDYRYFVPDHEVTYRMDLYGKEKLISKI